MNKKVLTTAMGAVLAGSMGFAHAGDVTVYGNVNVSIDAVDQDAGFSGGAGVDDVNMESNTSSFGFKGSEDLGNGLKAIFQVELQVDADETSSHTDRDQWVGLAGGFGKLRFGTISTGYKSHGAMVDPIYRTSLQGRGRGSSPTIPGGGGMQSRLHNGSGESRGRLTNHVRYDSPSFNGLGATFDYSFDDDDVNDGNDTFGLGGHYKNGNVLAFIDYITTDNGSTGANTDDDAWKVGGKYTMGEIAFYGQYENGALLSSSLNDDGETWHLGGSYTMGNTLLYLAFGQSEDLEATANNYEHDAITIAIDHHLSKRTDIYAGWNQVDVDRAGGAGGEHDLVSVGMRHKF